VNILIKVTLITEIASNGNLSCVDRRGELAGRGITGVVVRSGTSAVSKARSFLCSGDFVERLYRTTVGLLG